MTTSVLGSMYRDGRLTTERSDQERSKKLLEEADRTVETMERIAKRLKRVTDLYRERENPEKPR